MLRFIVDESTGRSVSEYLRAQGFDVVDVAADMPQATDEDILSVARTDDRIVMTNDKDFGELIFRIRRAPAGILLFRIGDDSAANRVRMARMVIERLGDRLRGRFTVVTDKSIRLRTLP